MAADSSVLREFLISVGFKINESTFAGFTAALSGVTGQVLAVGEVLYKVGEDVAKFTTKMAERMEDLYYASARIRDTISGIQNFSLAISEMGGTAEGARGSLEGLAKTIRTSPGVLTLLRGLGVNTNGGASSMMTQLAHVFQRMDKSSPFGYAIASRYASMLGIDDDTLWAMIRSPNADLLGRDKFSSLYSAVGMSPEQVGEQSAKFMNILRDTEAEFTVLSQIFEAKLLPYVKPVAEWFSHFFDDFLRNKTPLNTVLNDLGKILKGFWDLGVSFGTFVTHIPAVKKFFDYFFGWLEKFGGWMDTGANKLADTLEKASKGDKGAVNAVTKGLMDYGTGGIAGIIGGLIGGKAANKLDAAHWAALLGNWKWESGMDPTRVGDHGSAYGIGQWHSDRQKLFAQLFGHSMIGSSLSEQMQFGIWELFNNEKAGGSKFFGTNNVQDAAIAYGRFVERPQDQSTTALAGRAVLALKAMKNLGNVSRQMPSRITTITQNNKTDIHVHGNNAKDTAHAVHQGQDGAYADHLRQLKRASTL